MSSILVIDDDRVAARLLELALTRGGHVVEIVHDVGSAKAAARAGAHELMIADAFLPDGTGLDVLEFVRRELGSAVPVLLVTGQRQVGFVVRAEAAGANGWVTKPLSIRGLLDQVERLTPETNDVAPAR